MVRSSVTLERKTVTVLRGVIKHPFGPRRGLSSRRSTDGCRPWARPSRRRLARRPRRRLDRWCPTPRLWERQRRSQPPRNRGQRPPSRPLLPAAVHPSWARSRGCGTGWPRRRESLPTPPSREILRARSVRAYRRLERLRPALSPTWRVRGSRGSSLRDARWRRSIAPPTRRQPLSALPLRRALRLCVPGLCIPVPDSPPCRVGFRSGGPRPRRPLRSPRPAAGSPSRTCWIHRALGAALSCISCSRHRGRYGCLLPRLRRAGMRAVRAEGSRSMSLAEPIHRERTYYGAVAFGVVNVLIRAIQRVSLSSFDTYATRLLTEPVALFKPSPRECQRHNEASHCQPPRIPGRRTCQEGAATPANPDAVGGHSERRFLRARY